MKKLKDCETLICLTGWISTGKYVSLLPKDYQNSVDMPLSSLGGYTNKNAARSNFEVKLQYRHSPVVFLAFL